MEVTVFQQLRGESMRGNRERIASLALAAWLPFAITACASMNKTQKGAVIGAAGGAVVGGAIGKATGSTAKGAIIGAAVGGVAGGVIGAQMDKQARELAAKIPNAKVERVGEGMIVTFDSGLLFAFDSDVIQGSARTNLTNLANSLREYPNTEVLVVGHTDALGTDVYNMGLSDRRARSAANYLNTAGVRSDRLETAGRGESEPVADNVSDTGRSQNRRVEVAIFASDEYKRKVMASNGNN
jgi:outer membrane protein OmpA-like peptidoglycan-associated protein